MSDSEAHATGSVDAGSGTDEAVRDEGAAAVETGRTTGLRGALGPGGWFGPFSGSRWVSIVSIAVLTSMTWPFQPGTTGGHGVDPSWEIALSMLRDHGTVWGRDVVFNYGPLGFLGSVNGANLAGWTFQVLVAVACAWMAVRLLSRAVSPPVAAAATVVVFVVVYGPQSVPAINRMVILAVLWSLDAVLRTERLAVWHLAVVGACWGIAMMIKADTGAVVVAVTGTAVVLVSFLGGGIRRAARDGLVWLASGSIVAIATFAVFGGPLGALGPWVRGTIEIMSGFSSAMGTSRTPPESVYEQLGAVAICVAVVVLVAREARLPTARRVAGAIVSAVALYLTFRQGFVRYDFWHVRQFYVVVAMVPFAFAGLWSLRRIVGFVLATFLVMLPGQHPSPNLVLMPARSVVWAARSAVDVVGPGRLAELRNRRAEATRDHYRVPTSMLERIGDDTVAILPENLEIADGYRDLDWVPMPLLQDYQANTTALDRRNTELLTSSRGPAWIIRSRGATRVDRHFPRFDPPGENLELLCRYEVVERTRNDLELLRRRDDVCGSPEVVERRSAELGRAVRVPAPDGEDLVVARFSGIDAGLLPELQASLYRGARYRFEVPGVPRAWRFTPGTQESWHVLRAPSCVDLGTTGPQVEEFTIDAPGRVLGSTRYDVEFARIPVDCP